LKVGGSAEGVNAKIGIRGSYIEIGDPSVGERVVIIQGPVFIPSEHHKLILHPRKKLETATQDKITLQLPHCDPQLQTENSSETEDDSEYTDSDEESSTESENRSSAVN